MSRFRANSLPRRLAVTFTLTVAAAFLLTGCPRQAEHGDHGHGEDTDPTRTQTIELNVETPAVRDPNLTYLTGEVFSLAATDFQESPVLIITLLVGTDPRQLQIPLGTTQIRFDGRWPVSFELGVNPARVTESRHYGIFAEVRDGVHRLLHTPEPVPVLTRGHPIEDLIIELMPFP